MDKPKIPPALADWFRKKGAEGGRTRAAKYTPEQLSEWAKKGGRPRKNATQTTKKGVE